MKNNQKIKCNVKSCEYNKCDCNECNLEEIMVSCNSGCQNDKVNKKNETICDSFKMKQQ